jgi:hypothetical protein
MKKINLLLIIPLLGLLLTSCDSSDDPMTPDDTKGNIYITSSPADAQIWIDGINSLLTTPDTVTNVEEGVRNVTLKLQDYKDTTIAIGVTAEQTSVLGPIALVSDISTTLYGPKRIYESFGTPVSQPSGLDLSSGNAWGINSDSSGVVDIYFYSDQGGNSYLIQSADLAGLIRETDFLVGSGANLFDEEDSPLRNTGTWTIFIDEAENNYVFLYDHDGHYSKFKIVNRGGGTGLGDPAWVDVQWYYNNDVQDERF